MKKKKIKSGKNQYQYYLTLLTLGTCGSLHANPEGLHLVTGNASSSNPASHILEITSGKKAIIEWDSFSIANHEITRFIQEDSSSSVLNRITGDMSQILGTLESNGKVFLINPRGIIIGEGARIDTGSFIASTFDILNADFLEGKNLLFSGDSEHAIINLGTIHAAEGDVILLAHRIKNEGVISTTEGQVSLNSGSEFLLQTGTCKVFIRPKLSKNPSKEIGIENTGTIQAIEAHLKADGNLFAHAINHTGVIEATGIRNTNGRIHLVAENSKVDISGSMKASSGENGGKIHVISNQINLLDNAKLDVSGLANGGEILIGGDLHGDNPLTVPHASFTTMSEKATITASSLSKGSGGKVVLWADENTDFYGEIVGKGGPLGGDGGFVEISSPNTLTFKGKVDLSAPLGADGHLLLDPGDISIGLGGTPNCCINFCATPSVSLPNVSTTVISNSDLNAALQTCNVTLDTSSSSQSQNGNIDIGSLAIPQSHTLTLRANGNINIFTLLQINPTGTPINGDVLVIEAQGDVRLIPAATIIPAAITHTGTGGNISISCDNLLVQAGANPSAQAIISTNSAGITPKNLTINAVGNTERGGNITLRGGTNSTPGGGGNAVIGSNSSIDIISITAKNTLELNSNDSTANISSNGPIIINAQTISLIGEGITGSSAEILGSGSSSIDLTANTLSISTSESTSGIISTVNGNISGTVQNLTIQPMGSQNNTISTTGTGNISLTNNQNDATYLLAGNGTAISMINTQSGTISLEFQGFNSGLSLLGINSPAQILRTGPTVGNINITGTNGEAFLLVNGVLDTPLLSSASIENRSGNIVVNFSGQNSEILVGNDNVSSTSFMQTTTNPGDILITQNSGIFTVRGGNSATSNSGIQTTVGGKIEIIGSGLNVSLFGGTGAVSDAFISPTSSPTNITASSFSLIGGIGDVSTAYISPFNSGDITITASTILLQGGTGSVFSPAAISIVDSGSKIKITASDSLSILGGGSSGNNQALISSSNPINSNPLDLSLGGLLIQGGYGDATEAFITSSGSSITITGIGPNDLTLRGGEGANSSAMISSPASITIISPDQNLSLFGGLGAGSFSSITTTGGASSMMIQCKNLTMMGPSTGAGGGYTSLANVIGDMIIDASGNILMESGKTADTYTQILTQSGNISIGQNITSFNNLGLYGGGLNSYCRIFTQAGNVLIGDSTAPFGNLSIFGGDGSGAYAQIATANGNMIILNSREDVIIKGGNSPTGGISDASISGVSAAGNCALILTGSSLTLNGGSGIGEGSNQAFISLGSSPAGNSINMSITGTIEISASTGFGVTNAFIQSQSTVASPITISCESLFLQGAQSVNVSGYTSISTMLGNIDITAPNTISLTGGASVTGSSFALISNSNGGNISLNRTSNILLQGGSGIDSDAGIISSLLSGSGNISIPTSSLSLLGGNSFSGIGRARIAAITQGNITIDSTSGTGLISLIGGTGGSDNSSSVQAFNGLIDIDGSSLSVVGGIGTGNANASIFTSSPNNPITLTFSGDITISGAQLPNVTNGMSNASITTSSNGTASPITITAANLSLLGAATGSGNGFASITTNVGEISIDATGNILMQAGNPNISYAQIFAQNGNIKIGQNISSFENLSLYGGSGTNSYAQIFTSQGNIQIGQTPRSFGDLSIFGGNGFGAYARISTLQGNTVTLNSGGDVILKGGNSPSGGISDASIYGKANFPGATLALTLTGNSLTLEGGSGTGTGLNQAYILADLSALGNTVNVNTSGDINLTAGSGFGNTSTFIRSESGANNIVTIDCANLSLRGTETSSNPSGFASITSAGGTTTINSSSNISLFGGNSQLGSSYALIDVEFHGILTLTAANNIHIEGGLGLDSNAEITSNSVAGALGSISITSSSLQLIGGGSVNGTGQANIAILNDIGNIAINCQSAPGFIILQGGTGAGNNSVSIQADNGLITALGNTLSVVGGDGTGNTNASIFTSSANNPITLNFTSDINITGAQSPYLANGLSHALITTNSTGAASPITITSGNLSILGSPSGSGEGSASITTNIGSISIASTGNVQLISGNTPVSFTKIQTTEGALTLSTSGNIHLQGGMGALSASQIIRLGSAGDTTITAGSLTLSGGVGPSSFAQIGTNIPIAFPFTGNISFPTISGDVEVVGGASGGYALIGHGSPSASTVGIDFSANITFSSVTGNVYVSGGLLAPSFAQIGHVNSNSNSSILSGNITISTLGNVSVVDGGAPGYALIGMGGQSNTAVDSFTSDISITAKNVSLESQGVSEFTVGGYSIIGFLSPGSGGVTINATNLIIQTTQDISRLANTPTSRSIAGIGSYVSSISNSSSATITNLTLNAGQNFRFTLDNSPSQYSGGIDFVGTYFNQNSQAAGSSTITISAGRNFFFDEYMMGLANQGFLQNTNPKNITSHLPIDINVGNGFYTSQGAGNTMSVISSGILSINNLANPRGDVIIDNFTESYSGMNIIAGMNLILGNFAILNNTTSGNVSLVADNLNPISPDFNPAFGFTLITPAIVTNQNNTGKIYIYSTTEFSTFIGDEKTPSLNGNIFVHGPELGNTDTEKWGIYYPTIVASPSSYTVYYKNTEPTPRPPGPTPSNVAFLRLLSFDHYEGNFLISQMLYPQPEILDDYLSWAEAFSIEYDMKKYEKVRKRWGYRSGYDVFQKQKYILNRNKYFNFYELLLQRDVQIKR